MRTGGPFALLALLAVTACTMALPFGGGSEPPPMPLPGGQIEVTALDTPAAPDPGGAGVGGIEPRSAGVATDSPDVPPEAAAPDPAPDSAPDPAPDPAPDSEHNSAPDPAADPPPPALAKSEAQQRCERQGGEWAAASVSSLKTCVKPTRDGGKQCSKATDCQGECLARSQTCAPIAPLLGCNEILLRDGTRTTQCIE